MILGCHLSIAGGTYRALESAHRFGLDTVALFVRNQRQWRAPALGDDQAALFRQRRGELAISPVIAHGSYLVNLAGEGKFSEPSAKAAADELDRCGRMGIEFLVMHPGSHADAAAGIALLTDRLNEIVAGCPHEQVKVLLETTAGQGGNLGWNFEQLADMLARLRPAERFGVCLDTCHVFAAGYDIRTPEAYRRTMEQFDAIVGMDRLGVIHINDSKRDLGSRVDRHEHIGQGKIGPCGLANFVLDERFARTPFILETPKGLDAEGRNLDEINIATVRGIANRSQRQNILR
jgi:deoxyribonuclease-4